LERCDVQWSEGKWGRQRRWIGVVSLFRVSGPIWKLYPLVNYLFSIETL